MPAPDDVFEGLSEKNRGIRFVNKSIGVGEEIIAAMERKGMSQRDLARALNISETLVSRWLGGMHNFTLRTLTAIEEVLDTDLVLTAEQVEAKLGEHRPVMVHLALAHANAAFSSESWVNQRSHKIIIQRRNVDRHSTANRKEYSNA